MVRDRSQNSSYETASASGAGTSDQVRAGCAPLIRATIQILLSNSPAPTRVSRTPALKLKSTIYFVIIWSRKALPTCMCNRPRSKLLREFHLLLTLALRQKDLHCVGKFRALRCVIPYVVQSNDPAMQKTESISLRVTAEVKKAVERAARCQHRRAEGRGCLFRRHHWQYRPEREDAGRKH